MHKLKWTVAIAAALVAGGAAARAEDAGSARVYGVEISPDGKHYAVLRDAGEQRAFAVYSVDDAAAKPMGIGLGTIEIRDFEWGGNDYLLLEVSGDKEGIRTTTGLKTLTVARWLSISRITGKSETLFGNDRGSDYYYYMGSAGSLLAALPLENEHALFARTSVAVKPSGPTRLKEGTDELLLSVHKVNLKSGSPRQIAEGKAGTFDWVVDAEGAVVARIDQNEKSQEMAVFHADGGELAGVIPGEIVQQEKAVPYGLAGPDAPRALTYLLERDGARRLARFDLDTGAMSDAGVTQAPGPITRVLYDPREARVRVVYYSADRERAFHLEEADRKTQASLEKALPDAAIAIVSKSVDGARLIARAGYAGKAEEYYLFDKAAKRLELVAAN